MIGLFMALVFLGGCAWFGRKERNFRYWREEHPDWWRDPSISKLNERDPSWWTKLDPPG